MKIVFLGTPDFAATSLKNLLEKGKEVVAVVTAPDRKKGRGLEIAESAVKIEAKKWNIPVLQPTNLKDDTFIQSLQDYKPDLGVVVAFRMLPERVWNLPSLGTINLHASLLPQYRGAAPINWAIINGEKKTGITTFFLKHKIDTGDILLQGEVDIDEDMNAGQLHDLLAEKGAKLLCQSVEMIDANEYELVDQASLVSDQCSLKEAPKIFREDCRIDWNNSAEVIHNFIRGLSPYPGSWTAIKGDKDLTLKIFKSKKLESNKLKISQIKADKEKGLIIGTGKGDLLLEELQLQGKQRMKATDFIRGFDLKKLEIE